MCRGSSRWRKTANAVDADHGRARAVLGDEYRRGRRSGAHVEDTQGFVWDLPHGTLHDPPLSTRFLMFSPRSARRPARVV